MMLKKLKVKFVCITMIIVTVMLCAIFATVYTFTGRSLEAESIRMMEAIAADPFQLGRPDKDAEQVRLPYFVVRVGPFGEAVAMGGGYFDLSDKDYIDEIIGAAVFSDQDSGLLPEYKLRFLWSTTHGSPCLVFADVSSEQSTLHNLIKTFAAIGAGSLLAFLFVSIYLARWAVKPVEQAWEQQRQFVADASHELKTPLTVILTNAELLQAPGYGEEDRARFSSGILAMAHQMRGLVESLLELARLDSASVKPAMEALDLSGLLSDAVLPFEPLFFEQGLELQAEIEPDITVSGNAGQLRQAAEILLDNARKYSAPASRVDLRLRRQGSRCLLSVTSRGETISPADLKNIFKRFYRVDKARGMNQSYGLGLSIAESIVRGHGGRIWAESEDGVNRFFIELPI